MNGFEPTILGISVYIITIAQINEYLQGLLIIATLVYTVVKIIQLFYDQFSLSISFYNNGTINMYFLKEVIPTLFIVFFRKLTITPIN